MFDAISQKYLSGLTSDQQLAYYWQLMNQMPAGSYETAAPDYSQNSGSGDNSVGGGDAAARSLADNLTAANRNTAFEKTLSPADLANYQALTQQHNNDSQHYSNNLGWLSLAAPLAVYGGYTAAGAAGTGTGAATTATTGTAVEGGAATGAGLGGAAATGGGAAEGLGAGALEGAAGTGGGAGFTGAAAGAPELGMAGGEGVVGAAGGEAGALGGAGNGFWSSLASGNYGDAATAAGNYLTSPSGMTTASGLVSSYLQNRAAGNALDAQRSATNDANALAKYQFDTTRSDWAPYRALGRQGLAGYSNLLAHPEGVLNDPGVKFQMDQGTQAVDRSAASKGDLYSGATLKALERYGQDRAGTFYDTALGRYGNAAQIGATGVSGSQAAGQNYSNTAGSNLTGLGNAAAGNALLQGNVWGNALNGAVSAYKNYNGGG